MTRFIIKAAAGMVALGALTTAAQACISCEYVPEVVREHSTLREGKSYKRSSHGAGHAAQQQKAAAQARAIAAMRERQAAMQRAAMQRAAAQAKAKAAKAVAAAPSTAASTAKVETTPSTSVALVKADSEAATPADQPAAKIETASVDKPAADAPKNDVKDEPVGCKKFIPAVGVTLSVACK